MPDLRAAVANCVVGGELFSTHGTAGGRSVRNHIPLLLSGYRIDLYQLPFVILEPLSKLISRTVHTTDVVVRDVSPRDADIAERLVEDICTLLSFASTSQILPFKFEFESNTRRHGVHGAVQFFRPPIEIRDGSRVREFIQSSWVGFQRHKRARRLREVIDYITLSELPVQPLEVRLLLIFVVMESLKATYARTAGIPHIGGAFRQLSTPPKSNPRKEPRYSFHELLSMMLASVGMRRQLKRVISLRNQIIHFGLSDRPFTSLMRHYDVSQSVVQEYLLRLMGFRGGYFDYAGQGWKQI